MSKKQKITVAEFLKLPNVYPLTEGGPVLPCGRAIDPEIELTDLCEHLEIWADGEKKDQCDKCKFGEAVSEHIKCRRFPPSSDGKCHKSKDTQPIMMTDDWCGEFKVK